MFWFERAFLGGSPLEGDRGSQPNSLRISSGSQVVGQRRSLSMRRRESFLEIAALVTTIIAGILVIAEWWVKVM